MKYWSPVSRMPLLRCLGAALACALTFGLATPGAAYAANACVTKGGGVGGTGYAPEGGIGGTGSPVDGGANGTSGGGGGTGSAPGGGVGGTGAIAGGGVGGTGAIAAGGVGGTGRMAQNVGVVGTITGFASICINGLEVQYSPGIQVIANGLPSSTADLAVGQVVTIDASGNAQQADEFAGVRVSILNAVAGPVAALDAASHSLTVLGQTVLVTPQTLIADATGIKNFDFLQAGQLVRVSGLRLANGNIVASRIETALGLAQALVLGPVTQSDADGFSIYGLRVAYTDITGASAVSGGEVMVSGRLDGAAMRAERIALAPSLSFARQVDSLVLEGYIGSRGDSRISVGGISVTLSAATGVSGGSAADLRINQRVQVIGRLLPDRSIAADSILLSRDPLAPPSAASIFAPSKSKALAFSKPGDLKAADPNYDKTVLNLTGSRTGGTTGGTTAGGGGVVPGNTGGGVSGGGSGAGLGGGGIITPGGTSAKPPVTTVPVARPGLPPQVFRFDTLDFRLPGMPARAAH